MNMIKVIKSMRNNDFNNENPKYSTLIVIL